jgi:hypothetical protein
LDGAGNYAEAFAVGIMKQDFWSSLLPRKRKLVPWIFGVLIFYAILGFLILPPIVRHIAVKQISKQLDREVSIEKVKINPFAFSATIRSLLIKEKNGQPFVSWDEVYVNFQLSSFFGKAWTFKEISATKPFVHLKINEDGSFNFSDIIARFSTNSASAKSKTESKPLAVRIERLRVDGARLDFESRLAATNFAVGAIKNSSESDITASTNSIAGNLWLLRAVTNAVAMIFSSTNQLIGMLDDLETTNGAVHFEDWANSRPAKLDLSDITLAGKNISNLPVTNHTSELSLRWNKNGSVKISNAVSFSPLTADVQLDFDRIDLGTLDPYLEPKLDLFILSSEIGLRGKISLRTPENRLPEITFSGDTWLDDFHTVDGVMGEDLLKWDSMRVTGIDANLNPQTVSIKEIAVDNAYARVVIETNHSVNLLTALRMTNTNSVTATNEIIIAKTKSPALAKNSVALATNTPSSLPDISIGSIVISNAAIRYSDFSLKPNVNLAIEHASGIIAGISSKELQHADVNFHALVDNVGPADITGHINPFSGTQTNKIKIAIKDVDLTPTSPYGAKFAGYGIAEGKLSMDLTYEIVGRKLKSKNVVTLDQFTFGEKVDSPDATHLPVRLAIAILKDREGKIILDVPVEGSLDDPQFRIGKVVTRAVVNILEKVATSPFSLLGALFGGGGEELSYQDFAPGSAELSPDNAKKLDSLVKGLYARPGLNLEISGSTDPVNDRDGLQRTNLDRQLRARKWLTLRKSERATNTVDQVTLTPDERQSLVKKLYHEALADGRITSAIIAANTNLAVIAAQVPSRSSKIDKGATFLVKRSEQAATKSSAVAAQPRLVAIADPVEALLAAMIPVSDNDLTTLAANRAKAVRAYILQTGKVEATRIFLVENQTTGVRSDGSRAYLQFR